MASNRQPGRAGSVEVDNVLPGESVLLVGVSWPLGFLSLLCVGMIPTFLQAPNRRTGSILRHADWFEVFVLERQNYAIDFRNSRMYGSVGRRAGRPDGRVTPVLRLRSEVDRRAACRQPSRTADQCAPARMVEHIADRSASSVMAAQTPR